MPHAREPLPQLDPRVRRGPGRLLRVYAQSSIRCVSLHASQPAPPRSHRFLMRSGIRPDPNQHSRARADARRSAQAAYSLALQSGLLRVMTDVEKFALLLATLCHDLEHPVRPRLTGGPPPPRRGAAPASPGGPRLAGTPPGPRRGPADAAAHSAPCRRG